MASPFSFVLMPTTDNHHKLQQHQQQQQPIKAHSEPDPETKPRKQSTSRSQARKKQPQRGMGVAQLERLRIQERMKMLTEAATSTHLHPFYLGQPASDPVNGYGGGVSHGFPLYNTNNGVVVGNYGFNGNYNGSGGLGSGGVMVDPYLVGAPDFMKVVQAAAGTSRELSSMPKLNLHQFDQHTSTTTTSTTFCDFRFKKKRFNGENNNNIEFGYGGSRDKFSEISPMNGCDYLGLNLGNNNINFNGGGMDGFGARAARSALYATSHNLSEGKQMVANPGNCNSVGRGILMKYHEFFPGKTSGISSTSKEFVLPTESSVAVLGGEASFVTTSDYSGYSASINASNSIDLSLKLSY